MRYIIHSTTTRTQGWQADCWNWAKANEPFELYGVETEHLPFCQELSAACRCKCHSRQFYDEAVATFEPSSNSRARRPANKAQSCAAETVIALHAKGNCF